MKFHGLITYLSPPKFLRNRGNIFFILHSLYFFIKCLVYGSCLITVRLNLMFFLFFVCPTICNICIVYVKPTISQGFIFVILTAGKLMMNIVSVNIYRWLISWNSVLLTYVSVVHNKLGNGFDLGMHILTLRRQLWLENYVSFRQGGHLNAKNSQIRASAFASKYIALFYEDNKQQVRLIHLCCRVSSMSVCRVLLQQNTLCTKTILNPSVPWVLCY